MAPRAKTLSLGGGKEMRVVPPENRIVRGHWPAVVMHQGWLLKKGGVGLGTNKSWIKRYFVLYKTSQGHFLTYYADFTECPLFSTDRTYRNVVDLAKCTFIRPGSIREKDADAPPHCFDIVTIEREWTLCAETQENARRWLVLLTRAVDEDVAILPDEELLFKVKPKVDPTGLMPAADYNTSLRISAHGISVCIPDKNAKSSALGEAPERELYFWVYTDFYKWSLLSQNGKLALLVNVFADSSFGRRNEFIFRNKEAVRLASSIEFFIEKFMCVMHIRLETEPGAFDEHPAAVEDAGASQGLHELDEGDQYQYDEPIGATEVDLLDLDMGELPVQAPRSNGVTRQSSNSNADPFGDSPFGESDSQSVARPMAPAPVQPKTASLFDDDDLLGASYAPAPVVAPVLTQPVSAPAANPFAADPFDHEEILVAAAVPTPALPPQPKFAPPLSPAQEAQHAQWLRLFLARNSGSFYDDGSLQIAATFEVRGSQGRIAFFFRNQSPSTLADLQLRVEDEAGLTRFELGQGPTTIAALSSSPTLQQQLMLECMKPVPGGPRVTISYVDSLLGRRSSTLPLPVTVTSFNDPLTLGGADFTTRWEALSGPGLQAQEVLSPPRVVPAEIAALMTSVS